MVRDVEAPVEERPPAGASHGQLVDGGVGIALSLQRRVGDRVTSGKTIRYTVLEYIISLLHRIFFSMGVYTMYYCMCTTTSR